MSIGLGAVIGIGVALLLYFATVWIKADEKLMDRFKDEKRW